MKRTSICLSDPVLERARALVREQKEEDHRFCFSAYVEQLIRRDLEERAEREEIEEEVPA